MLNITTELQNALDTLKNAAIPIHYWVDLNKKEIIFRAHTGPLNIICRKEISNYDQTYSVNDETFVTCQECLEWLHA